MALIIKFDHMGQKKQMLRLQERNLMWDYIKFDEKNSSILLHDLSRLSPSK